MSEQEAAQDDIYAEPARKGEGQYLSLYIPNRVVALLESRIASQGSNISWRVLALRLAKQAITEEAGQQFERPS